MIIKLCQLCLSESKYKKQTEMVAIGPNLDYWVCPICDGPAWMSGH